MDAEIKDPDRRSDRNSRNDSSAKERRSHRGRDDSGAEDRSSRKHRHRGGDYDSRDDSSRRDHRHRERSRSRERSHRHQQRSRSPPPKRRRRSRSDSRSPRPKGDRRSRAPLPSQAESFRGGNNDNNAAPSASDGPPIEKQKPNYKPTGLLAKEANTIAGTTTVLKYHEPPEARKPPPKEAWRMYVFKQQEALSTIHLHERSVWLVGRDEKVTDVFLEHPSISKQHAVVQFRYLTSTNEFGDRTGRVRPYLLDLESANGTKLNGERIEARRFVELVDGDVVAFGDSEREYVLMLPPVDK